MIIKFFKIDKYKEKWLQSPAMKLSDCSHEIKRRLLLERKAMTILDSILKRRDIILSTKVHLVKAMVFRRLSAKELMPSKCDAGEDS